MKKFLLLCCVVLTAPILITSCKDDPAEPSGVMGPYFNTGEGSICIYSNYILPTNSAIEQLDENDTLTQGSNSVVLAKNSKLMYHHFVNPFTLTSSTANYAIYEEANKGYVNSDFMKIFLPDFLQIAWNIVFDDDKWYLLVDDNAKSEWILDSFALVNAALPFPVLDSLGISFDGNLNFGIKKGKDTTIASASAKASTFIMTIFFEGSIKSTIPEVQLVLLFFGKVRVDFVQTNFYLGPKKGLLGIYSPVQDVKAYSIANPEVLNYPLTTNAGFDKRLISIDIK